MHQKVKIDDRYYSIEHFSHDGKFLIQSLIFGAERLNHLSVRKAFMLRAKNGYISDLKLEITEMKLGVDIGALFSEEERSF
jgi:hypothetical protein